MASVRHCGAQPVWSFGSSPGLLPAGSQGNLLGGGRVAPIKPLLTDGFKQVICRLCRADVAERLVSGGESAKSNKRRARARRGQGGRFAFGRIVLVCVA